MFVPFQLPVHSSHGHTWWKCSCDDPNATDDLSVVTTRQRVYGFRRSTNDGSSGINERASFVRPVRVATILFAVAVTFHGARRHRRFPDDISTARTGAHGTKMSNGMCRGHAFCSRRPASIFTRKQLLLLPSCWPFFTT